MKFRIFNKSWELIDDGQNWLVSPNGSIFSWDKENNKLTEVDYCIIQRASGLKDKNGVEIYEGDELRTNQYLDGEYYRECRKVIFDNGEFWLEGGGPLYNAVTCYEVEV